MENLHQLLLNYLANARPKSISSTPWEGGSNTFFDEWPGLPFDVGAAPPGAQFDFGSNPTAPNTAEAPVGQPSDTRRVAAPTDSAQASAPMLSVPSDPTPARTLIRENRDQHRSDQIAALQNAYRQAPPENRAPVFGSKDLVWAVPALIAAFSGGNGPSIAGQLLSGAARGKALGSERDNPNRLQNWQYAQQRALAEAQMAGMRTGFDDQDLNEANAIAGNHRESSPLPPLSAEAKAFADQYDPENAQMAATRALSQIKANEASGITLGEANLQSAFDALDEDSLAKVQGALAALVDDRSALAPAHTNAKLHFGLAALTSTIQRKIGQMEQMKGLLGKPGEPVDPKLVRAFRVGADQIQGLQRLRYQLDQNARAWRQSVGMPGGGVEIPDDMKETKSRRSGLPRIGWYGTF